MTKRRVRIRADGWIVHDGGPCPVPAGTLIDIEHSNGQMWFGEKAIPTGTLWQARDEPRIVAYRIVAA